jgi:hypothetical protein
MAGPNSTPNGDTTLSLGHVNEKFACNLHGEKHLDWCEETESGISTGKFDFPNCNVVSLRNYLASRNRLVTGKTK